MFSLPHDHVHLSILREDIAVSNWRCPVLRKGCCAYLSLYQEKRSVVLKSELTKLKLMLLFKHHYSSHLYLDCKRLYFRPVNRAKDHSQHRKRFKFLAVLDVTGTKWLMEKCGDEVMDCLEKGDESSGQGKGTKVK